MSDEFTRPPSPPAHPPSADVNETPAVAQRTPTSRWDVPTPPSIPPAVEAMSEDGTLGRIGQYVLLAKLGGGGMGVVYKARHRDLGREVALKTILPESAQHATTRERFLREGRMLARVKSDHVVQVLDAFESGGCLYLVMELLSGATLDKWLKGKPDEQGSASDALRVAGDVLRGLAALHARRLIHRDIKPSNLWVEPGAERTVILDLGLAREVGGDDITMAAAAGRPIGTPSYMSPEQARCDPLGPATDLFSLGAVLYRILTGKTPFFREGDLEATLEAVRSFEPRPIVSQVPGVPAALAEFVHRLLSKRADGRFKDAAAALDELARVQERIAATATPLPPRPGDLFGREAQLADVLERLRRGGALTLTGAFGVGKTALAAAAAHALKDEAVTVVWVDCQRAVRLEECLREVSAALSGDRCESTPAEHLKDRVADQLTKRAALLVLDKLRTLQDFGPAARWVAGLRPPAKALVTTYNVPPELAGQVVVVPVPPLADAARLFRARAAAAGGTDELPAGEVAALCQAVGNNPMAIGFLAVQAAYTPLSDLLESVAAGIARFDASTAGGNPAPNGLRACFAEMFGALTQPAQWALLGMSVVQAPFGSELAGAIIGTRDWRAGVARELVAAQLWELSNQRYAIKPLIRLLAHEELGDRRPAAEMEAARRATALAKALSAAAAAGGGPDRKYLNWCQAELPNLTALAEDAARHGDDATTLALTRALEAFWARRGFWDVAERLYRTAIASAARCGDRAAEAACQEYRGYVCRHLGRFAEADAAYRAALDLCDRHPDETAPHRPLVLVRYGKLCAVLDRPDEAERHLTAATELYRAAGDERWLAVATIYLADLYKHSRTDRAVELLTDALRRARDVGDVRREAKCQYHLGSTYLRLDRLADARLALEEGLRLAGEADDRIRESQCRVALGLVADREGLWSQAEEHLACGLQLARTLGLRLHEGDTMRRMAKLLYDRNELDRARKFAREGLAILSATEDKRGASEARGMLAQIEQALASRPTPTS